MERTLHGSQRPRHRTHRSRTRCLQGWRRRKLPATGHVCPMDTGGHGHRRTWTQEDMGKEGSPGPHKQHRHTRTTGTQGSQLRGSKHTTTGGKASCEVQRACHQPWALCRQCTAAPHTGTTPPPLQKKCGRAPKRRSWGRGQRAGRHRTKSCPWSRFANRGNRHALGKPHICVLQCLFAIFFGMCVTG